MLPPNKTSKLSEMEDHLTTEVFREEAIAKLSSAVQIRTVSFDDMGLVGEDERWDDFFDFHDYLERAFPLLHATLHKEIVNELGLVYTWEGSDSKLKPTLLMAHQDVVPVPDDTAQEWTHAPFGGEYYDGYVWGRGASDCKNTLIASMSAIEQLINAKYEPRRTVILAFGFDEEISGSQGALQISDVLLKRYQEKGIAVIIDEGTPIFRDVFGSAFAFPGVAEKGYIDVTIIVRMDGGHSSIPPPHTGIGVMSELITQIEENPYSPNLDTKNPTLALLQCASEHSPKFPAELRKLLENHPPFSPQPDDVFKIHKPETLGKDELAEALAQLSATIKYLMTTSVAVDVINGGVKVNALPERTVANINHRINVGSSSKDVKAKLTDLAKTMAEKHNLTLNCFNDGEESPRSITLIEEDRTLEPSPLAPTHIDKVTPYFILAGTTRGMYGEEVFVSPGMATGNTDTRHYWKLTNHIFRYVPGWDKDEPDGLNNVHTVNERISVTAHVNTVRWYSMFIRNMDEADLVT
jgi:Gly-Xaa carboxypeptidase